jgi:hypothetical protein
MRTNILIILIIIIGKGVEAQNITNSLLDSPEVQLDMAKANEMLIEAKISLTNKMVQLNPSNASGISESVSVPVVKNAATTKLTVRAITNFDGNVIPAEDVAYFNSLGYSDEQIRTFNVVKTNQVASSPTPADLKNAIIYIDNFLGGGKTGIPVDVISIKKGVLKFRFSEKDFNYSGDFSVLLMTPREHQNPYFGFGKPEKAKLLTLGDFFKDEKDGTVILQDAVIWEKSDGFIDAVAGDKEWILSGSYSISN